MTSTYTFLAVRAGDDIDIGHVNTTAYVRRAAQLPRPRRSAGPPYGASASRRTYPDTTVNFVINTDVDWAGGTSEPDGIEQIFLTTNGNITATELIGDMLVGHIHSTAGDVSLFSGARSSTPTAPRRSTSRPSTSP